MFKVEVIWAPVPKIVACSFHSVMTDEHKHRQNLLNYINDLKSKANSRLTSISFRHHVCPWISSLTHGLCNQSMRSWVNVVDPLHTSHGALMLSISMNVRHHKFNIVEKLGSFWECSYYMWQEKWMGETFIRNSFKLCEVSLYLPNQILLHLQRLIVRLSADNRRSKRISW